MKETKDSNKTQFYKKWWFWVIIVVVVFLIIAMASGKPKETNGDGSTGADSSVQENKSFGVGDTVQADGMEISVLSVERNYDPGKTYVEPKDGEEFVKVNVSLHNTSNATNSYNILDWKIEDADGDMSTYTDAISAQADDALHSGDLAADGKKKASIVFSVPKDSALKLHYIVNSFTNEEVVINL